MPSNRFALMVFLIASAAAGRAQAYCRMTASGTGTNVECDSSGTFLAWRHRCTSYAINEKGSRDLSAAQLQQVLASSFGAWEQASCTSTKQPTGIKATLLGEPSECDKAEYDSDGPNANTIVFVSDWATRYPTGADAAFAVTTVWHDTKTGEIFDADIEVNQDRIVDKKTSKVIPIQYAICPDNARGCTNGSVDLQNVLTHEVGHFYGMAHPPATQAGSEFATMSGVSSIGETIKRTLAQDDIDGICAIYPSGSLDSSCDSTPRGGLSLVCKPPSSSCSVAFASTQGSARTSWTIGAAFFGTLIFRRIRRRRDRG